MKTLKRIERRFLFIFSFWLALYCLAPPTLALEGLQAGMKAPLFKLKNLDGRDLSLAEQQDSNVTVVVFWATWGDHSPSVLERMEKLYRKHKKEKLSVLAVNVDKQQLTGDDLVAIKKTVTRLHLTFPILLDPGLRVFREYGVVAVPSTVVIDKEGVIRGEMAAFPLAVREDLFDLVDAMAEKRELVKREKVTGYQPVPRAVRYYNLGRAMAARGMSDAVDENLKKSISTDPSFVLPLLVLAKLYRERAETEEAIEYRGSTTVTATFKSERERYINDAGELAAKALRLAPDNASVLTETALILLSQGNRPLARERLLEAIKKDPSYTPAHFHIASLLVREGKVKEGEEEFEKALRLNPLDHQGYYVMAEAYEDKGIEEKAVRAYKKLYEILYREKELFPYSYGR